jgi:hypothetical protein
MYQGCSDVLNINTASVVVYHIVMFHKSQPQTKPRKSYWPWYVFCVERLTIPFKFGKYFFLASAHQVPVQNRLRLSLRCARYSNIQKHVFTLFQHSGSCLSEWNFMALYMSTGSSKYVFLKQKHNHSSDWNPFQKLNKARSITLMISNFANYRMWGLLIL